MERMTRLPLGPKQRSTIFDRATDGMREVGTLLIAFAPLDVALQGVNGNVATLITFLVVGALLFCAAVYLEVAKIR